MNAVQEARFALEKAHLATPETGGMGENGCRDRHDPDEAITPGLEQSRISVEQRFVVSLKRIYERARVEIETSKTQVILSILANELREMINVVLGAMWTVRCLHCLKQQTWLHNAFWNDGHRNPPTQDHPGSQILRQLFDRIMLANNFVHLGTLPDSSSHAKDFNSSNTSPTAAPVVTDGGARPKVLARTGRQGSS
jgi:hypothetical protein